MRVSQIFIFFLACYCASLSVMGQVASPHNFPHASGASPTLVSQMPGFLSSSLLTMGMDGTVGITINDGVASLQAFLLDSLMNPLIGMSAPPLGGSGLLAIAKDHKIWGGYNSGGDMHISVFTRTGTVLNQFKVVGSTATGLVADTSGHIFITYNTTSTSGFGVMRFSTGFVPDFYKWVNYPGLSGGSTWCIDQRMYVGCGSAIVVLDANADPVKVIQNPPNKYAVFQDHGIASLEISTSQDSLYIVRRDSSMNVLWSKRFKPGFFFNPTYSITRVDLVAMPGSGDLQIVESARGNIAWLCSASTTTDEMRQYLFGPQGQMLGENWIYEQMHLGAGFTPSGDLMTLQALPFCILPATAYSLRSKLWAGFDIRSTCTGSVPATPTANYVPGSGPTLGSIPTVTSSSLTFVPETVNLNITPWTGTGTYTCHKPCLTLNGTQALGGGQVAFQDDAVGFYNITYDFGDGTFGHTPDPVHAYPSGLPYVVTVTASNACGSTTASTNPINPCILPVIGSPASACVGLPNLYRETSGLPNDSLQWLVNGVSAGIGDTLLWTPATAGSYQIGLIYHDGVCHDTTTITATAFGGLPLPAFTYSLGTFLTLNFANASTNGLSYAWDFGDGGTSTAANPAHTYATNGSYNICLTATNGCGSAQSCQTWNCPFPTAAFTASPNGATVAITDQSVGATSMTWDFGDGQTASGAVSSHTYSSTGTFNICQTVTNSCATVSICHAVTVVAVSNSFYRIDFPALGVSTPKGVASNAAGNNLTVGGSSVGAFMQLTDAQGGVLWTQTYPTANYAFNDVVALPNGNFLVVGGSTVGSQGGMDAAWFEVDGSGTIVTRKSVGTTSAEFWTGVSADRSGGYLLSSLEYNLAGRIDAGLNLLWSHSLGLVSAVRGFQVADNSFWFVGLRGLAQSTIRFLHFDANGTPMEEYDVLYGSGGGFNGIAGNKFDCKLACDGTIYFMAATDEYVSNVGQVEKLGLVSFNTAAHTGRATMARFTSNVSGTAPYYDVYPQSLAIKPNGNLQILGYLNLRADVNTNPRREKLIVEANPSTLTINAAIAYGASATQDLYLSMCSLASGSYLAAATVDGTLQMHKFNAGSQCQVGSSTLTPVPFHETVNTTFTYNASFVYGSSPYGTAGTPGSPVSTSLAGLETVACATPCGAPAVAGFTYTVSGNSVTFTSTSTPGSNLVWTIPGQSCLTASAFTLAGFCGPTNVTLTASNGCGASSVTQTIITSNTVSGILGPDQMRCPGSVVLTPGNGYATYAWSTGATTSAITTSTAGIYMVTVTTTSGCTGADTMNLAYYPPVGSLSIGPNQQHCPNVATTFTATAGFSSYLWNTGATTQSISPTTNGTYTVTATNANGCTATASATLSNLAGPTSVSAGASQTRCPGVSATFSATTGFASYLWSNGATTRVITVTAPGLYTVTATTAAGCQFTASVTLFNFTVPALSIGPNQSVCLGGSATFTASSGFTSYLWSNGATTNSITVTTAGTYSVTATTANGCTATASASLSTNGAGVSIGPNQTICGSGSATFTATAGFASYLWSNGATTSSITVSTAGTYSVTATDNNGCAGSSSATLTIGPLPTVSIGPNQTVCPGANATFTATAGFASYLWSNGATTNAITVSTVGTYAVTATDANGCTATASATLSNFPAPTVSIGPNQTVCLGANATFTATAGFASYLWSNGATTNAITVNAPLTYSVTATNANGCTATASANLSNFPAPSVSIGPNQTVCPGANATFTATAGFTSYLWSNGATTNAITVNAPLTYSVTATNANGCTATASANLSNFPAPSVSIGPNQTVCPGANATFTATAGFASYHWNTGATTASITVSTPGSYTVTATNVSGCTGTASATLSNFPSANFSLGPDTTFCPDTTWQLSGPNGGTYLWSNSATSQSIAVGTAGTYSLHYTDANGCTATDAINLAVSADCVWPGDANHDGIADNQDLLAVGFGFGFSGPTRPNASPSWYGQPAPNWATALPSLVNHKHPDCDGNGTIDYLDTTLIATNYGYTHSKGTGVTAGIPLTIVPELDSFPAGDSVFFKVVLGDANNLVVNGYGVAFSFHIDAPQVTNGTLYARYLQSFLGNSTVDLLTLTHTETGTGNWHIGLSRHDRIGHSGAGAIMRVGFLPAQVYPLTSTLGYVPVSLFNPAGVDGDFNPLLLSASDDSIFIYNPVNALAQPQGLMAWNLYPVPTAGTAILEIQLSSAVTAQATLVDMHGRVLRPLCDGSTLVAGTNRVAVETQDLAEGMYFVKLTVDGQSRMKKLVVER